MKKKIFKTLAIVLIMTTVFTLSATIYTVPLAATVIYLPNGYYLLGDVDATTGITSSDSRLILRASVKLENLTSAQRKKADIDRDGKITSSDSRKVLRIAVGSDPYIVLCPNSKTYEEKIPNMYLVGGPYSPMRAGLYYDMNGDLTTYEQLDEGESYLYYSQTGLRLFNRKPYSPGNEPTTLDPCRCEVCGKSSVGVNGHSPCASGGCTRWLVDKNCPECGVFVPSHACHTCKN